jgi:hypothetical protein
MYTDCSIRSIPKLAICTNDPLLDQWAVKFYGIYNYAGLGMKMSVHMSALIVNISEVAW